MDAAHAPIRHIVFDIGAVLIHYDPQIPFRRLIPDATERASFFADVCTHDWNIEQDRGRTWEVAEALLIADHPEKAHLICGFRQNWHEMVSHPYQDTVDIMLGFIDEGRDVTMLTNFASDTFRQAQTMYPFLTRPRGVTVSGDVRMLKPEFGIYERHVTDFGLDPAGCLFIDDSLKNVQGAINAGWQAVQYTGGAQLREDLTRFGLTG